MMSKPLNFRSGGPSEPPSSLGATLALGFRPFFLLAAGFSALALPIWLAMHRGVDVPSALPGSFWHGHEMVFGYTAAVVAGFLLTAVRNWTRIPTPSGAPLAMLAGVWLLGRVAMLTPWTGLAAASNLVFLPALAVAIGRPLVLAKSRRNYKILAIVFALWALQVVAFADALGVSAAGGLAPRALKAGVGMLVVLIVVIAGRIIPLFTRNTTGVDGIRSLPGLDAAAIGLAVAHVACWLVPVWSPLAAATGIAAGLATLGRMTHWGFRHALRVPLLWILHLGHALIGVGLAASGFEMLGTAPLPISALHTMAVGGIGLSTLGMMARVSLGHTGRTLVTAPAANVALVLVSAAALVRIFAPVAVRFGLYTLVIEVAGALWTLAFLTYLWTYASILTTPRPDGKPG